MPPSWWPADSTQAPALPASTTPLQSEISGKSGRRGCSERAARAGARGPKGRRGPPKEGVGADEGGVEQTLFNWVKADRLGRLKGADSKLVSAEQMEISRLRAELARVKMERDILGKATAYFAKAQS